MFDEMKGYFLSIGIRHVIVACPSCYKIFKQYGGEISVKSVYELLVQNALPDTKKMEGTVTIHDSCALRFEEPVHELYGI